MNAPNTLHVLIVEDEKLPARRLERMVREVLGENLASLAVAESLEAAGDYLAGRSVDLVLLDLNLHGEDGFDLVRQAAAGAFKTVVVSANTDKAIDAFAYGVVDFVPKPFDQERLQQALERVQGRARAASPAKYLSVRKYGKVELIPVDQVIHLRGAGDYVELHLRDGRMELHSKTLESLETVLPGHFERVHKSFIVDLRELRKIHLHGGGKYLMELRSGAQVPISRTKYRELKERL